MIEGHQREAGSSMFPPRKRELEADTTEEPLVHVAGYSSKVNSTGWVEYTLELGYRTRSRDSDGQWWQNPSLNAINLYGPGSEIQAEESTRDHYRSGIMDEHGRRLRLVRIPPHRRREAMRTLAEGVSADKERQKTEREEKAAHDRRMTEEPRPGETPRDIVRQEISAQCGCQRCTELRTEIEQRRSDRREATHVRQEDIPPEGMTEEQSEQWEQNRGLQFVNKKVDPALQEQEQQR